MNCYIKNKKYRTAVHSILTKEKPRSIATLKTGDGGGGGDMYIDKTKRPIEVRT